MDKDNFINKIKDGAIKGYVVHKILPSLTIAQAILESAWGESKLTREANNLFGIKAYGNQESYKIDTYEYVNGKKVLEKSCPFRAYRTWEMSILDHTELLCKDRYKSVREAKTYVEACKAVQKCGYATDPKYAQLLIQLIVQNNLQSIDEEAQYNIENLPILKLGSKGEYVKLLQKYLTKHGAELKIDGVFGPITEASVRLFQDKKRLVNDGIVGIKTWTRLTK